jgi:hypothetical protein
MEVCSGNEQSLELVCKLQAAMIGVGEKPEKGERPSDEIDHRFHCSGRQKTLEAE